VTHWDEGAIWNGARWFLSLGKSGDYMPLFSPPLPPFLYSIGAWVGRGVHGSIWLAVIFGAASIVIIYLLGRALLSPLAGLAAAVMLSVSGINVLYSRSLLTEAFYVAFLLLTLLATVHYLKTRTLRAVVLAGLSGACLQYTKYNGVLALGPLLAFLVYDALTSSRIAGDEQWKSARHLAVLAGIISAAVLINLAALSIAGDLHDFRAHFSHYIKHSAATPSSIGAYLELVVPISVLVLALAGLIYVLAQRRSAPWTMVHIAFVLYCAFLFNYTFYLRLLAPISIFLIIYAAAGVYGIVNLLPGKLHIPLLLVACVLFGAETSRKLPHYVQQDHQGYVRAAQFLNTVPIDTPVIMVTQRYVWGDLRRPVFYSPGTTAPVLQRHTASANEALLVCDAYGYYKYDPRLIERFIATLSPSQLIKVISNPVSFDVVENTLTLEELERLDRDQKLQKEVFTIQVFKLYKRDIERFIAIVAEDKF
jgi:4-amino-4-deoxy-L-arabinose transferase-like glycosyltransferase